ncbi:MAG: cytochrome C [Verrucomicrobia bacterium CG_4_10_14_3_um_filter_43_23]|nr:MAG: hypothetical protein AUJ82_05335 [Verrucomicrobia bacterium CG1_02_43_26]PIP58749.1 MAG: cytochrome C [Verrucomicrobia bacterium CG22_combo_CG10-13_8_21_14_all_43_17]PIX58205.1 MAG: cytochrome C [Verrucomicrobia bacterium CG_4_10_14_3_um_filter_43_23]PIY61540.1 MAG: cytochrome C [Verrucomicrobia bacterium CG_4_10_14_0_8_um_filter_43_34]PJA44392.1 MAG: cytochrome C [Verrucomicrobia bacterium CG_4_9_14_3_um_filter_43_20]
MRYFLAIFAFLCIATIAVLGFRGDKFKKTPLYIFPDMDFQAKYQPQGKNHFFADMRDDRPVVQGTVVRGYGWDTQQVFAGDYEYAPAKNPSLFSGKNAEGEFLTTFPIPVDHKLMQLGQDKFNIFCIVCHGAAGDGEGITKQYGMISTPTYHDKRLRDMPIGEIFNTITNGKGLMNSYADKLSPQERWAVIAYVRALQRAQNASIEDVPGEFREDLGL